MERSDRPPLSGLDEDTALRSILEGTATETGQRFFAALVENLARALNTHGAWVIDNLPDWKRWLDLGRAIQGPGQPAPRVLERFDRIIKLGGN